ncbi:MAG: fibrobacter succinogenes major paralogous domain-containing protein [Dysgonamonadaceae bacterium]|nr:fibrobacter succinogenes major paralogous domain-containing protein [Dysgonamonadaceae bacterium]
MKRTIFLATITALILLGAASGAKAQVTIGENTAPTVTLDVKGKHAEAARPDGILIPKLTGNQLKAKWDASAYPGGVDINKTEGVLVYITAACSPVAASGTGFEYITAPGFYYFSLDGNAWKPLVSGGETHEAAPYVEPWNVAGTTNPATSNTQNIYQTGSVGIGANRPAASLDVSATATDTAGITAPRYTLTELNARQSYYTARQEGALVYITDGSGSVIPGYSDQISCKGYVYWNGNHWISQCGTPTIWMNPSPGGQPKPFTFYETGVETVQPLTFSVSTNGVTPTYQWYKVTGSNVHVRISEPCTSSDGTGYNTNAFTPNVLKGTTLNAANNGFYKYFCVAKTTDLPGDSTVSDIAEIAVGCGAKNLEGEWHSFLCFNLGAQTLTIDAQKNYSITFSIPNASSGLHYYVANEEYLYGDLYQWGRIGDGHQFRVGNPGTSDAPSNQAAFGSLAINDYESGNLIGFTQHYPDNQIKRTSTAWYGKFITGGGDNNWAYPLSTSIKDNLWQSGRNFANDPCTKIKETYTGADPFTPANIGTVDAETNDWFSWYPSTENSNSAGGGVGNTGWKLPARDDWAALYRGGTASGAPANALSNTWVSNNTNGFEVRPDGVTTTLFLPASGHRNFDNGRLYHQGAHGYYWTSTFGGANAYYLMIHSGSIAPANIDNINFRSSGFALRCTKAL